MNSYEGEHDRSFHSLFLCYLAQRLFGERNERSLVCHMTSCSLVSRVSVIGVPVQMLFEFDEQSERGRDNSGDYFFLAKTINRASGDTLFPIGT